MKWRRLWGSTEDACVATAPLQHHCRCHRSRRTSHLHDHELLVAAALLVVVYLQALAGQRVLRQVIGRAVAGGRAGGNQCVFRISRSEITPCFLRCAFAQLAGTSGRS